MSFLRKLTTLLIAILMLLNIINITMIKAQDENRVVVQKNSITWLYSTRRESGRLVPYISLSLDKSSLSYQYIDYIERFLHESKDISRMNITLVFIGNERMYYQFIYETSETFVNIDSNIVIDEDYIVIQWFNAKTIVMNTSYINSTEYHVMLPPQVIEIVDKEYNLSISIGYLVYKLKTNIGIVTEDLNLYDLSIKKDMYVTYLTRKFNSSSYRPYFNFTKIPMYAWIEISITSFNDYEVITVMLNGLGINSINNALNMLSHTIPTLDLVADVIENLNLRTVYNIVNVEHKIDIVNKTMNTVQSYIVYNNEYAKLINMLITKYNIADPYIRVILNQSSSILRIQMMLQDRNAININMSEKDIKYFLINITYSLSLPSLINNINWSKIINDAQVVDLRTSENVRISNSSTLALNTIVALTFMLTSLQTAIIIYVVLYVYRSMKRSLVRESIEMCGIQNLKFLLIYPEIY